MFRLRSCLPHWMTSPSVTPKILKDALAMEVLDRLYVGKEWQIKEHQKLTAPVKGTRSWLSTDEDI